MNPLRFFIIISGKTLKADDAFLKNLEDKISSLKKVEKVEECDFILVFCSVASRAGTDIEAALQQLQNTSDSKPAVVVVLHHTFDPDSVVPDSSRSVQREKTITVDVLFYEDLGLLQCTRNAESLVKVTNYIKSEIKTTSGSQMNQEKSKAKIKQPDETFLIAKREAEEDVKKLKKYEELVDITGKLLNAELIVATELKLVLLGTESEKAAVRSTILAREEGGEDARIKVNVVDTPDLFSTGPSLKEAIQAHLSSAGPCAFLLVVPIKNSPVYIPKEEEDFLKDIINNMVENCWKKTLILFTVTEEDERRTLTENIDSIMAGKQEVQTLVEKCGNNYHCLNVNESGDGSQVLKLLNKVEKMVGEDGNQVIEIFKDMETKRKERGDLQLKMGKTLKTYSEFIAGYEKDIQGLKETEDNEKKEWIKSIKTKTETKKEIGEKILKMYEKAGMEEDRFIKVILPGNQQAIWMSVPNQQSQQRDRELDELYTWFQSLDKSSETTLKSSAED